MNLLARFLGTPRLARLPIPLMRAGFCWVFGPRLLLLEHTGRTSGEPRYAALEVVVDERPGAIVLASGFGTRAQWYRNLKADPRCRVWHMYARGVPARAELLSPGESAKVLADYARRHPRLWKRLRQVIVEVTGETEPIIPMVRLHLHQQPL